jgi:hypothetical protein
MALREHGRRPPGSGHHRRARQSIFLFYLTYFHKIYKKHIMK